MPRSLCAPPILTWLRAEEAGDHTQRRQGQSTAVPGLPSSKCSRAPEALTAPWTGGRPTCYSRGPEPGPETAMDCIFCKIASGEIPSPFVYESERVFAIRDTGW